MKINLLKPKKIVMGIAIVMVIILISYIVFISKTISLTNLNQFCVENSDTNSKTFIRYEIESNENYGFWVSESIGNDINQELFIFRKANFLFIKNTNRFWYVNQIKSDSIEEITSVMFMPRDVYGRKTGVNLMLFFSQNLSEIENYTIEFEENGNRCIMYGEVSTKQPFIIYLSNLGSKDGVIRTYKESKFYNEKGAIIYTK